jgi:hypothetical protein
MDRRTSAGVHAHADEGIRRIPDPEVTPIISGISARIALFMLIMP